MSAGNVVRVGDNCTGHGTFPPRSCPNGASAVFVNGKSVVRDGDIWLIHCNSSGGDCHQSDAAEFSSKVFAEGKGVVRKDDLLKSLNPIPCTSKADESSTDTFADPN
jgi:uncharacterized Zn-binding protein involved in type VI secretion